MKKKNYSAPAVEVVVLLEDESLLAGSTGKIPNNPNDSENDW